MLAPARAALHGRMRSGWCQQQQQPYFNAVAWPCLLRRRQGAASGRGCGWQRAAASDGRSSSRQRGGSRRVAAHVRGGRAAARQPRVQTAYRPATHRRPGAAVSAWQWHWKRWARWWRWHLGWRSIASAGLWCRQGVYMSCELSGWRREGVLADWWPSFAQCNPGAAMAQQGAARPLAASERRAAQWQRQVNS